MNPHGMTAKAWPFEEARALLARIQKHGNPKGYVLFETGYGPSGLPHIGTFGEVARTSMVRAAFEQISDIPTKLICFSDDMDGLRKVPDNLPNQEMIAANIGKPLTAIPDPFGTHESFGHHMNARLRAFLDHFGFDYEFKSSTATYKSGEFDQALLTILRNHEKVMKVMLPTLGEERQQTYFPFLPVSPRSGKVLLAKVNKVDTEAGTITYVEEDGSEETVPVTGGHCKLQWKPDMGMRWAALGVDYEMYGKDHLASAPLYDAICKIAGGIPPQQMMFELFLDAEGQKISKSKGNGITIDEWLTYAPSESLALYMFTKPRTAKKLHFDVIPQQVDDYLTYVEKYPLAEDAAKLENPAWYIHAGHVPAPESNVKFSLLLNLVSACNAEDKSVLWGFLKRELPNATPENSPMLDKLCGFAVRYYHDFVKPTKQFRAPTEHERTALTDLRAYLTTVADGTPSDEIMTKIYDFGLKYYSKETMRDWFKAMYETLLGSQQGPRMGSFIALFGAKETIALIDNALKQQAAA
ncbi:MAG: lysine--tRNA ligase [Alphaproteobacteria bacterium]|nr:lysine--tRNA ligase [Alphaproteobacteria bacterium]